MNKQPPKLPYFQQHTVQSRDSYSLENIRVGSKIKSPQNITSTQQRVATPKSLLQNVQNMQSLQSIKDQISALQSTLKQKSRINGQSGGGVTQPTSQLTSPVVSKVESMSKTERSFFTLIKEQLKQVSKLQNNSSEDPTNSQHSQYFHNKIQRRHSQKSNQLIQHPQSVSPLMDHGEITAQQQFSIGRYTQLDKKKTMIKSSGSHPDFDLTIKSSKKHTENKMTSSLLTKDEEVDRIEKQESDAYQQKISAIEDKKLKMLKKLKQRYQEEKFKILEHFEKEAHAEKQNFISKLRLRLADLAKPQILKLSGSQFNLRSQRSNSNKVKVNYDMMQQKDTSNSSSSSDYDQIMKIQNKISLVEEDESSEEEIIKEKKHLVSSLKKETRQFKESQKKKQKVRFKNNPQCDLKKFQDDEMKEIKLRNKSPISRYRTEEEISIQMDQRLQELLLKYY